MVAVLAEALDGDDVLALERRTTGVHAGALRLAVHVHGARAAGRDAAAELRAGQAQLVAEVPQERHRGIALEGALHAVHAQLGHAGYP